jgi:hypothetical protein
MSTAFDEFRRKAQGMLPEHADSETTSSVAFHLMKSELENEKKQMQSELENEKKLEVLKIKMEMEMEKKLELQEMGMKLELQKMKQRQSNAFHSKQLSAVVQRLVVCMYVRIVNLFVHLFFRNLPHHFFPLSVFCFHTDKSSRTF